MAKKLFPTFLPKCLRVSPSGVDVGTLHSSRLSLRQVALLFLTTAAAFLVHGYHPAVEDSEIYLPGIKKALNPSLYPYNNQFFAAHASRTFFPNLIAASVNLTHIPLDYALLLWHLASIFLLLLACWKIGKLCFNDERAQWGGVLLAAALLTIPVAGTALYILDEYLNTRSISTFTILFALVAVAERRYVRAVLWCIFTGLIHPLMVVFGVSYFVLLLWLRRGQRAVVSAALLSVGLFLPFLQPLTGAYRDALQAHSYFFLLRWEWYEWLGIFGPIALLLWFRKIAQQKGLPGFELLANTSIWFAIFYFVVGLLITIPERFAGLTLLQPMRALHLVYILLFVFSGGLLARYVLKAEMWRWCVLFLPLCAGMFYAQRQLFPATPHIEWPGVTPANDWLQSFAWIRENTPVDAYFALDPQHMALPGEDQHGFRAVAERSMLADNIKDGGAVTMFPKMADEWQRQVQAQAGWKQFQRDDYLRLQREFGVTWVLVEQPGPGGLLCQYENKMLKVCRLN